MKRKVLVIRFGHFEVNSADAIACKKIHSEGIESALGIPFGKMGVISIFYTDKPISEIVKIYEEISTEFGVPMPIIAYELDNPAAGHFLNVVDNFSVLLEKAKEIWPDNMVNFYTNQGSECTLTLDELLDKVSQVGLQNINETERKRLEQLSKQ